MVIRLEREGMGQSEPFETTDAETGVTSEFDNPSGPMILKSDSWDGKLSQGEENNHPGPA